MSGTKGAAAAVTVDREHMLRAALVAAAVQTGKDIIPILGNMLIEASGDTMALTASDMDVAVRLVVPATCEGEPLATTVAAKKLVSLVNGSADDCTIVMKHAEGARDLSLSAGRGSYKLPVLPRDDFPLMPFDDGPLTFTVASNQLAGALARTAFAEDENVARYYLRGTALIADAGELVAVATEGNVLARLPVAAAPDDWPTIILPSKLTALLVRIFKDGAGDVTVALDPSLARVRFVWGPWTITSKLIDGQFPAAWRNVIPEPMAERQVTVDSASIQRAIRCVAEMAEAKTRIVEMQLARDCVTLRCQSVEVGSGEEAVPAACPVEAMTLRFVNHHLRDAIAAASGDSVRLTFGEDGRAPVRIEPEAGGGFLGVIKPLNI